jgi:hypothetical protein
MSGRIALIHRPCLFAFSLRLLQLFCHRVQEKLIHQGGTRSPQRVGNGFELRAESLRAGAR